MPAKRSPKSQRPSDPNADITLTMTDMAHGGRALGRYRGQTVFVPYTIPGEMVQARLRPARGKARIADGKTLLTVSADRVAPQCPHFGPGRCWACQWQHIAYPSQCLLKQDVLADQLSRLGGWSDTTLEAALRPTVPSPQTYGYNAHMTFSRTAEGYYGHPREDSKTIEPIETCLVLHPDLLALLQSLELDFPQVSRLKVARGDDGAQMLILSLTTEAEPELEADFPISVNLLLPDNEPVNLIGEAHLRYHIGERVLRVTAGSFFRANIPQVEALCNALLQALNLQGGEAVLDLYGGVGVYSAFIAAHAQLVTLVESYPPAATDAEANLAHAANVDIIEGTVEDFLAEISAEAAHYDIAIVDPPAHGMSAEAMHHLLEIAPSRIAYIGGDPASLARDSRQLARGGYTLAHAQVIDFAPQTYYIEALAIFDKTERERKP